MDGSGDRRFQFRHLLGRGGFGEVYRATMTTPGGLQAEVAVKLLRTDGANGDHVRRLRDEGRLLSGLQHSAILRVWDLASLEGRVGLVTEYVPGQDLGDCFAPPDPMTPRALVEVAAQVAEGLEVAWSGPRPGSDAPMRIVHRDIKPSNLRIGPHGQVKILDFGIAHTEHADREAKTGANSTLGSLAYMAPERFGRRAPGPACDIYSLGCVVFEGLAGRRLHPEAIPLEMVGIATDSEQWSEVIETSIAELPGEVPEGLRQLLRDVLAHDPDVRPSARDFALRCEALAGELPGHTLKRWARERSWPDDNHESGPLDGRALTDGTLDTGAAALPDDRSQDTYQFDGPVEEYLGSTAPIAEPAAAGSRRYWPIALIGLLALVVLVALGRGLKVEGEVTLEPTPQVETAPTLAPAPAPAPAPALGTVPVAEPEPEAAPAPAPEAAPVVAPGPSPAPEAAPTAAPVPVPQPAPAPAPAPEPDAGTADPTPEPETAAVATGRVVVTGATLVKVEVDGQVVPADAVPARQEAFLTIDFGADVHRIGPHYVSEGMALGVRCVRMTQECSVE